MPDLALFVIVGCRFPSMDEQTVEPIKHVNMFVFSSRLVTTKAERIPSAYYLEQ